MAESATETSRTWTVVTAGEPNAGIALVANGIVGYELFKKEISAVGVEDEQTLLNGILVRVCTFAGPVDANEMVSHCATNRVDLLLYCIPIASDGLQLDLKGVQEGMRKLSDAYGADIWMHSVIVFTKAGSCSKCSEPDLNRSLHTNWKATIQRILKGISKSVNPNKIRVALAGEENQPSLPGRDFWLSYLWDESWQACKKDHQSNMKSASTNRIIEREDMMKRVKAQSYYDQPIYDQPVYMRQMSKLKKIGLGSATGGVVAGGIATGATVGALIGALAIGIPSFGIAAGAGLVIGGVIGGSIGGSVAGAAVGGGMAAKEAKKKKEERECEYIAISMQCHIIVTCNIISLK